MLNNVALQLSLHAYRAYFGAVIDKADKWTVLFLISAIAVTYSSSIPAISNPVNLALKAVKPDPISVNLSINLFLEIWLYSQISKNKLILKFTDIGSGLTAFNAKLTGFEIAGIDEEYVTAIAEIKNNTVHLSALSITAPKYARYAWSDNCKATLFNKEGLPASSFETKD